MKRLLPAVLALLLLPFAAACEDDEVADPGRCVVSVGWSKGSMPAPHSWTWRLEVDEAGKATFTATAGHGDLIPEESFTADEADHASLCREVGRIPEDRSLKVGGRHLTWTIDGTKGSSTEQDQYGPAEAAAHRVIGAERLEKAEKAHAEYERTHDR